MKSQVRETWFEVQKGASIKAHVPTEMGLATTSTPELGWSSCLSFYLPGSLLEVFARPPPKKIYLKALPKARNISGLCLIIIVCSISNASLFQPGWAMGWKFLGSWS